METQSALDGSKMKVKFLHARDGRTVLDGGAKRPGFKSANHTGFNTVAQRMQYRQLGNLAVGVDRHIDHHVSLHTVG